MMSAVRRQTFVSPLAIPAIASAVNNGIVHSRWLGVSLKSKWNSFPAARIWTDAKSSSAMPYSLRVPQNHFRAESNISGVMCMAAILSHDGDIQALDKRRRLQPARLRACGGFHRAAWCDSV